MGQSVSTYTTYADYRPDVGVIAGHPHKPFPSNITAGLAQDPPSAAALQSLSDFMRLFFYVPLTPSIYIAFFTGLIYLGLLIIAAAAIGVYRWRRGQFWILRLERRARGLYIVPNALNAFLLFELSFCLSWGVYGIGAFQSYRVENWFFIRKLEAISLHCWFPLYLGILSAAVGSFFSVPGALDPGSNAAHIHNIMRRPWVINTITIGLPLGLIACIVPLCVLAQLSRTRQIDHYRDFADRIEGSITSSNLDGVSLSTTLVQAYLQEASDLWSESAQNTWTRAGWSVWNAFYCFLFLFYSIAGGWMLIVVKRQVEASKAIVDKEERYHRELVVAHQDEPSALLFQPLLSPGATVPPTSPRTASQFSSKHSPSLAATAISSPSTAYSPLQSEKRYLQSDDVEATAAASPEHTLLSPLPPPQPVESQPAPPSAAVLRWRYLRRCYRSLVIMYAGIIAVLGISIGTGGFLAASITREWLAGPYESAYVLGVYVLLQTWTRVVFGSITLGAVVFRSFDHSAMGGASAEAISEKREGTTTANGRGLSTSEAHHGISTGVDSVSSTTSPHRVLQDPATSDLASVPENATMSLPAVSSMEEVATSGSCHALLTEPMSPATDSGAASAPSTSASTSALQEGHVYNAGASSLEYTTTSPLLSRRSVSNALASLALSQSTRSASMGKLDVLPRPSSSQSLQLLAMQKCDSRARRFSASAPPPNRPLPTPVPRSDRRPGSASSTSSTVTNRQRQASHSTSLAQRRASANAELASSARLLQLSAALESRRDSCRIAPEYTPADRTGWRSLVSEDCLGNAASPFQAGWNGFAQPAACEQSGCADAAQESATQQLATTANPVPPSPAATNASSDEVDHLSELIPRSALTARANPSKHHARSSSSPPDSPVDGEAFHFE
ncbi:hypothetical protein BCV69DRAFT_310039 [Microstroma glucosiphilum]|uniref:Uncharacterized protein n=1 Tax=Pseudomicrostroma glucosiphilum TaxID=1684307 RepID=A0A316ULY0_9BASI|nr:hypothetical protein BCV69DRAFT_310039 [Pseudomicrostroma glucosiphilum]PWN24205.1 hypothetical protein BCV69DRAFT_310039 [Pseudomicrostroma glucosiphilum]